MVLSTLVFAAAALADVSLETQELALAMLHYAPENEYAVKLGQYSTCPGSDAIMNIHTMAQMKVTFQDSCSEVAQEITARAEGMDGWVDPHNRGTYTFLSNNNNLITTKRLTGNRLFIDKQTFSLQPTGTNSTGCVAYMCSESQGTSADSGGTDMCDMFDLFCNSGTTNPDNGVSCKPVKYNLKYTINSEECGRYVFENEYAAHQCQNAETTCLKNPSFMNEEHVKAVANLEQPPKLEIPYKLLQYSTCPGAPDAFANIHTMAQMSVTFKNNCADVAAEIKARANGDVAMNGEAWVDPHNRGTYWVVSSTDSMITTERRTGNRLFVDKQTFALTTTAEGGCNAQMCSESQGTSANSGGTDLCDMWDLYCNSDAVNPDNGVHCEPVKFNLTYTINSEECGRYVFENEYAAHTCQNKETTCLKNPSSMQASSSLARILKAIGQ